MARSPGISPTPTLWGIPAVSPAVYGGGTSFIMGYRSLKKNLPRKLSKTEYPYARKKNPEKISEKSIILFDIIVRSYEEVFVLNLILGPEYFP